MATASASGATFDASGTYRYLLWRSWGEGPVIGFVMLNPHRADASADDATIRRCLGFARSWGFGQLLVGNLFAYRCRQPAELRHVADPIGPENDRYLHDLGKQVETLVLAWGNWGALMQRDRIVRQLLRNHRHIVCLGYTKQAQPRHPLYLPAGTNRLPCG
jgi:hypothetical protein